MTLKHAVSASGALRRSLARAPGPQEQLSTPRDLTIRYAGGKLSGELVTSTVGTDSPPKHGKIALECHSS